VSQVPWTQLLFLLLGRAGWRIAAVWSVRRIHIGAIVPDGGVVAGGVIHHRPAEAIQTLFIGFTIGVKYAVHGVNGSM
jgi:hypothetical protein